MYTRCPKCETCFRVTERHLAIAKGKVRCGKCQLVFNALDNAIDDLPGNSAATQTTAKTGSTFSTPPQSSIQQPQKADIKHAAAPVDDKAVANKTTATKQQVTAKPTKVKQEKKSPVPPPKVAPPLYKTDTGQTDAKVTSNLDKKINEIKTEQTKTTSANTLQDHHDAFHVDDDSFDDNFDFDAAIDELAHAAEEVTYDYDSTAIIEEPTSLKTTATKATKQEQVNESKSDNIFSTDAYDSTNASSVADIINEMEGQLSLDIDIPAPKQTVKDNYDADNEFQFTGLDEEPAKASEDKQDQVEESDDDFIKNNFDLDEIDLVDELDELDDEFDHEQAVVESITENIEESAEDFVKQFEALEPPVNQLKEE
ncbi:MAG: zinc-ribbon domain-containing protein, partial [Gammaproteobacteria bacterium]|nr:zinc-ribbon domain-containing protein [Gammaproteobacteria bacterium]